MEKSLGISGYLQGVKYQLFANLCIKKVAEW